MPHSHILVADAQSHAVCRLAPDTSLLRSSQDAPWQGYTLEHQQLPPTTTDEVYMRRHLISVQRAPPSVLTCVVGRQHAVVRLRPDDAFFSPAHVPHRCHWPDPTEVLNLALDPALVATIAREHCHATHLDFAHQGCRDAHILTVAQALDAEMTSGYPAGRLYTDYLIHGFIIYLVTSYALQRPRVVAPERLSPTTLNQALAFMHAHYATNLHLADLARVVHLSPYHFARSFKAMTGRAPHQYLLQIRVERARQLLEAGQLSVDAVAHAVGFVDRTHLARYIRRAYGVTPRRLTRRPAAALDDA
jgi:AraC family transcriptional regulator